MTWAKVDDQFAEHPKVLALGRDRFAAMGLWLLGLTYSSRYLTDGFIPAGALPSGTNKLASRLVAVLLWERVQDGYRIHDFSDYQPSREEAEKLRADRAEAGRKGGLRSGSTRSSKREANASAPAQQRLQTNAKQNATPARTRTREILSEENQAREGAANGSAPILGIPATDPRHPVAALLAGRFKWPSISEEQWDTLFQVVDNEYPRGTSKGRNPHEGWGWLAGELAAVPPDAGDPMRYILNRHNRALAERRVGT